MTGTVWKQLAPGGSHKRKASTMGTPTEPVRGKKTKTGTSRAFVYVSTTHTVEFSENRARFVLTPSFVFHPHRSHRSCTCTVSEKNVAYDERVSIPIPPTPRKVRKSVGQASSMKELVAGRSKGMFSSRLSLGVLNTVSVIVPISAPKLARTPVSRVASAKRPAANSGKGMYSLHWLHTR